MTHRLQETARITEAAAAEARKSGRMVVQLISPGWGSSGYYSTAVLEQAAADNVIPAGTHMYADHPTDTEAIERPGRSIKDLMSVTTEAARIATATDVAAGAETGALVAEVRVAAPYRELVEDLVDTIGVSIRGDASNIEVGEAEGRTGPLIEGLAHVQSVDWVTRAGRGGRVLQLMESARTNARAINHGITEATVNDTREGLQNVLRDAYPSPDDGNTWVYVRDFDDSTVWFEIEGSGDDTGLYAQTYTESGGAVSLDGDRTEVRVVTNYVPVTRPDSTTPTTEETQEVTMGNTTIEESELNALRETAGRVDALTTERDTAITERDTAREELATRDRLDRARALITENETRRTSEVTFTPLEERGLLADLPLSEDGNLDEAAFTRTVTEAATSALETRGAGSVSGFGGSPVGGGEQLTEAALDDAVGAAFGRTPNKIGA